MHTIQIRFFGAFKTAHTAGGMTLEVPVHTTVETLKELIKQRLLADDPASRGSNLIPKSVLADDRSILPDEADVTDYPHLALLPPVCGG